MIGRHLLAMIFPRTPNKLVFFVTSQCNASCKTCFYPTTKVKPSQELSLDEIIKTSQSMGAIYWLLLSGGEPFLRSDVDDICTTFIKNNFVHTLQIPTNGGNSNVVVSKVRQILIKNPELPSLIVAISLDAIGEEHDRICSTSGLYDEAIKTLKHLQEVQRKDSRLQIKIGLTYSHYNHKDLLRICDYFEKKYHPDAINVGLLRGIPKDQRAASFSIENYIKVSQCLDESRFERAKKEIVLRSYLDNQFSLPCRAGRNLGVLAETGEVYACELQNESLGNLRDCNYNFKKIWRGPIAKKVRREILKNKCHCTYECVLGLNLFLNVKGYLKMFFNRKRLFKTKI